MEIRASASAVRRCDDIPAGDIAITFFVTNEAKPHGLGARGLLTFDRRSNDSRLTTLNSFVSVARFCLSYNPAALLRYVFPLVQGHVICSTITLRLSVCLSAIIIIIIIIIITSVKR